MKNIYRSMLTAMLGMVMLHTEAQLVSTFEDFNLSVGAYKNGSGLSVEGEFASGHVSFSNTYETSFGGYWSAGWAYSSVTNDTSSGSGNMYASYAASGNASSSNYGIGQPGSILRIAGADQGKVVKGLYVTNSTFAALSMKNGDAFAKKFGGVSGNDPDYFILTVKSYNNGMIGLDSVNFYLADYRSSDNTQDYIVKNWTWVDLASLGNTDSLVFALHSSDITGGWMNTPAFFCIDDVITDQDTADFENLFLAPNAYWNKRIAQFNTIFEDAWGAFPNAYNTSSYGDYWSSGFAISNIADTSTMGYDNLYASYAGAGYSSETYAVVQQRAWIYENMQPIPIENWVSLKGMYVTNSTYAALSMKNGDAFAKKFGGVSGNDEDWFKLSVVGYLNGTRKTDTVHFYLADYRFSDNSQDYIVKDWQWVDLSDLGMWDSLQLILTSSDVGQFGMNTPGFFCIDNFEVEMHSTVSEIKKAVNNSAVYPNPASELLTIDVNVKSADVGIYDLNGRLMLSSSVTGNHRTLSLASLHPGLYMVRIESEGAVATKKLVKE